MQNIDLAARTVKYLDLNDNGRQQLKGFDFLVLATGLRRSWPIVPQAQTKDAYLKEADALISQLEKPSVHPTVVIGGGGCIHNPCDLLCVRLTIEIQAR